MKLTEKQKRFADEYIKSGNIEQSAVTAGYSKAYARGNAHKLVANVSIKSYIDERMRTIENKRIMTAKEAVEFLTSVS